MVRNTDYYKRLFSELRVGNLAGGGKAPHKPVLLLALIKAFEKEIFNSNRIYLTEPELVGLFKSTWKDVVDDCRCHPVIYMPFFHMKSERFWTLRAAPGYEEWLQHAKSPKSFSFLSKAVICAEIDEELAVLMSNESCRSELWDLLIDSCFGRKKVKEKKIYNQYFEDIISQIVAEQPSQYRLSVEQAAEKMQEDEQEEDRFLRNVAFRKEVLKQYNDTCCVSRMKIISDDKVKLLDACHIVPFAESHDDTISNGIPLTSTLHRAFDEGLISIDDHYRVVVSGAFEEYNNSPFNLGQFKGKEIVKPANTVYAPGKHNLKWHRKKWGFAS